MESKGIMLLAIVAMITMIQGTSQPVHYPPVVAPEPIGCPNSHVGYRLNPYSYTCVRFVSELKSWTDAKAYCENAGENMATFRSQDDAAWLRHQQMAGGWRDTAWIGGRRADAGSPWAWYGRVTGEIPYAYWADGQPNNPDYEQCLGTYGPLWYYWDDFPCTLVRKFFCERGA